MAIKHAAAKALRQAKKAIARNRAMIRRIKDLKKKTVKSVAAQEGAAAIEAFRELTKAVDKAAKRNIIKRNAAARIKSRVAKILNAIKKK